MPLQPGDAAPRVSAVNQHGDDVELTFDEPTVLYFYPEDNSPGCTTEATQFTLERETYREADVDVYGVSTDSVESHRRFAEEQGIEVDLLADPDGQIADAFDVPRQPNGSTERTTFVLDQGEVVRVYTGVTPDGHARTVLMDLLDDGLVSLEGA